MRSAPRSEITASGRKSVAYVLKRFPRLSETFILNEILALEEMDLRIKIVSIHEADTAVHKHASSVRAPIYYVPESVFSELPQMLRAQGHFLAKSPGRWIRAFNIMFWRHSRKAVVHWLKAGLVARSLEGTDVGHIHAHFSTSPTTIAMISSTLLGIRYSLTCHAKDIYAEGRLHSPGLFRNLARASFVVVVSEKTKRDVLEAWPGLPPEKVHVVYNGLDLERFRFRSTEPNHNMILSVGRMVEKKGFPYLLEACALLTRRSVDFRGEIVGYGGLKGALAEKISSLQLEDRVRLVGPLPQDELIPRYHDASVFCLAALVADNSDRDILPNVVKEAMAVGVPVLTTSIPGMEELVEHESTGLVVPPKDPEALARGMELLLNDQELRGRLALAGRRFIEERFDRSKNTSHLLRLFEDQLSRSREPGRLSQRAGGGRFKACFSGGTQ